MARAVALTPPYSTGMMATGTAPRNDLAEADIEKARPDPESPFFCSLE